MDARRFFTCECGHRLRFGAYYCGKCHQETIRANRMSFWVLPAIGLTGMLLITGILLTR